MEATAGRGDTKKTEIAAVNHFIGKKVSVNQTPVVLLPLTPARVTREEGLFHPSGGKMAPGDGWMYEEDNVPD